MSRDTAKYWVNGERLVSVTEALELAGLSDWSKVPADVLEHARWRGTEVHRITADQDLGRHPGFIDLELRGYVEAYARFRMDKHFVPTLREHVVINQRHRYAGTLDIQGPLDGFEALIDLKCVADLSEAVGLQTAGYTLGLDQPLMRRYALQLRPDSTYNLVQYRRTSDALDFLAAVRIAHFRIRTERIQLDHMENAA